MFVSYIIYLHANYYIANGMVDSEKIALIAAEKKDPSICGKIRTGPFFLEGIDVTTEDIIFGCYLETAKLLNNEEICDYIPESNYSGYRSFCIRNIALEKEEPLLCEKIQDQLDKGSCYSYFTETGTDYSVCERIDDSNRGTKLSGKDLCYVKSVIYSKDITICDEKVKTEYYKDSCYTIIARELKDPSICEKIQNTDYDEFRKRDCISGAQ